MSLTQSELAALAAQLGLDVVTRRLPPGYLGAFDHRHRRILLATGLTPVERRCVLAHELGHAVHGHRGSTPAAERAAERFAARVLIDPGAFARARLWARDEAELAEALDVTLDVLIAYGEHLRARVA